MAAKIAGYLNTGIGAKMRGEILRSLLPVMGLTVAAIITGACATDKNHTESEGSDSALPQTAVSDNAQPEVATIPSQTPDGERQSAFVSVDGAPLDLYRASWTTASCENYLEANSEPRFITLKWTAERGSNNKIVVAITALPDGEFGEASVIDGERRFYAANDGSVQMTVVGDTYQVKGNFRAVDVDMVSTGPDQNVVLAIRCDNYSFLDD